MTPSDLPRAAQTGAEHARANTVAVLLAAGAGTRFGDERHKLDALLAATSTEPSMTVFARSLGVVARADIGHIVVVVGRWVPTDQLGDQMAANSQITVVDNPAWADGQITSLLCGLAAADELGADRAVVGLADQPFVSTDAWRVVADEPGALVAATYGGRRANPVALDRSVWPLLPTSGDEGARSIMRIRPDLVSEVACSGSPDDIDTTEDLRRWQNN